MDNKTRRVVVIGILLFVGVLFVGGFGDSITGNAVVGSQVVELGLEDEVQVLGREISIINVKDATRMSTFGSPRESEVVLKVSGFAGTINMRKASDINGLKIKLLSAEYPKTPDVRIKILVSKAMGARPNAGIVTWPYPFIKNNQYDTCIVISDDYYDEEIYAARLIAISLQQKRFRAPFVIPESEIQTSSCGRNLILVGEPCRFETMAEVVRDSSCSLGLNKGEGYLEYVSKSSIPDSGYMVVSGNSEKDVVKAATALVHQNDFYGMQSNKVLVYGNHANDYSLKIKELGTVHTVTRGESVEVRKNE